MNIKLVTNYIVEESILRHTIDFKCTYFNIDSEKIYIYRKGIGFLSIDKNKIFELDIISNGYKSYIEFNAGKVIDILPKSITKKELLNLLKYNYKKEGGLND